MAKVCPKCSADNSDEARFCEQCAAPLNPEAAAELAASAPATAPAQRSNPAVNWTALIIVVLIIAVVAWLLRTPQAPKPGAMPGANTAAGGANAENPHAQAGGGAMGGDVMKQLSDAKAALDKDPLATESLITLYQMYGMIGREKEVRPYLDKSYDALVKKRGELGKDASKLLAQLVTAAMMGNDAEGAMGVLEKYQKLVPDDTSILGMLGDVSFDTGKTDDAIKWYTLYLDKSKPETEGETYWRVRTDRATMYLNLGKPVEGKDSVALAVSELEHITQNSPTLWNGWFNLGVAYNTAGQKDKAKSAWAKADALATGEMEKWRVAAELAKLEGKEPPPPPSNPHGEMGAEGGMADPHGGMDPGSAGGADPHGGMGGGTANPHGGDMGGGA